MRRHALAAASLLVGVAPAGAAVLQFSGKAEVRAGYTTNPFVRRSNGQGTPLAGVTLAPSVNYDLGKHSFTLSGLYQREQYLRHYGDGTTTGVRLSQRSELGPRLTMSSNAAYSSSINSFFANDADNNVQVDQDPLSIGTRSRRIQGETTFDYRPGAADDLTLSANASHGSYERSSGLRSYDQYGGRASYTRQISDRTRIGGSMGYTHSQSGGFPAVTSYEPGFILVQQFSAIWSFNGNVGASIRRTPALGLTSKGLGFNASLCGRYPTTSVCVTGSRSTAASGIGGSRISTDLSVRIRHDLSSTDKVDLTANYTSSKAVNFTGGGGIQITQVSAGYDHVLGRRWSAGLDGRFQAREQGGVSNATSLGATVHVRYLFRQRG